MSVLLPCVEIGLSDATYSVIWLHGLGADGHDFEPIVDELTLTHNIRFIFPHAPSIPVSINNGMVMPAWYDIKAMQIDSLQDAEGIHHSEKAILALIEREIERGVNSENIILAGFSQGGAIALHTALRYSKPLAGIMGLSTYLPLVDTVEKEMHSANKNTSIFLAHGSLDPVVPFNLALETQDTLNELGYSSVLKKYHMEHSVCPEEINDISDWINACFK
jgi:phospholipase/carboxylesterase